MVVQAPDTMRAGRLEGISLDDAPDELKVSVDSCISFYSALGCCGKDTHGCITPKTIALSSTPGLF